MAAWRYEISLLVLKKYFTSERNERVQYFSTLEEKFLISARPCNILYIYHKLDFFIEHGILCTSSPLPPPLYPPSLLTCSLGFSIIVCLRYYDKLG